MRVVLNYQSRIEWSMAIRRSVVLDVVKQSIGDFQDGLIGDILVGSAAGDVVRETVFTRDMREAT